MSSINNYYKDFECDERTTRLVERIMEEYKPLLRWVKNRPNKYGEDFKLDLYQMTLYNLTLNTYNRVHKHNYTDDEIIRYGAQSIYMAYLTSVRNLPVNIAMLDVYPHSIDEDYDENGRVPSGHILVPTEEDENLNRLGEPSLEELIETLPCDDSLKTAILMMAQGYKQIEAAEALGIPSKRLAMRMMAFRSSKKLGEWLKNNKIENFFEK